MPPTMEELANKINGAADMLHKAVERQDKEIRDFGATTAETKTQISRIDAELTELLGAKRGVSKRIDDLDVRMQRLNVPAPAEKKGTEPSAQKMAFLKWVRSGEKSLTPEEKKSLVEDATGQYLVEPELDAEIERILPKITVVRSLASIRTIGKDRIKIRSIGGVTVGWGKLETAEQELPESTLTPGAPWYQYVEDLYGLTKIGEDELMDADVNLEAILAEEFSRALGEAEDAAFVIGSGHDSNEPEGTTTNATLLGNAITCAAPAAVAVEDFLTLMYACPTQYRRNGSFLMHSQTELAIRKLRAKSGTEDPNEGPFLWQPSVQEGRPNTFIGRPVYTQDDMADLTDAGGVIAVFGDIKAGYRIVDRVGMTLQRLSELYAEDGLVGFKIHKRVTGNVMKASQKPLVLLLEGTGS